MLEQYLTPGWTTILITLVGFISFYLGKIVLDFYPNNEDKSLHYIVGLILFLTYILIPILFFYYFPGLILNLSLIWFFIFWIAYFLLAKYFKIKMNVFEVKRGMASNLFYNVFSKNISKFGFKLEDRPKLKKLFENLFMKLPSQLKIIFLGYLIIFIIINLISFFDNWIIRIFILIVTISIFNKIIILHNAKNIRYGAVNIEDINGKKFKGKLIKQDSNYVVLYCNEKERYTFPRENVKSIKTNIKINIKEVEKKIGFIAKMFDCKL